MLMVVLMSKYKNNIKFIVAFALMLSTLLIFRGISSTPTYVDDVSVSEPEQTQPAKESEPRVAKSSLIQDNITPPNNVMARKHPSKILAHNPTAPEYEYYLMATTNDPQLSSSWHLNKIQTEHAWEITTGSSTNVVAVIDSPFALTHEDLIDKWHDNPGETGDTQDGDNCWDGSPKDKAANNCDDDGNGYIDDWRGYDFINDDNNVQAGLTNPSGDAVSHGTLVAGTVAATANNSKGSAGVDQGGKIMPLQVFDDDGNATTTDIVAAVEYAADNGATVINLSLGSNGNDSLLRTAIQEANAAGVTVVASAGNCALNDEPICYTLTAPGRMTYPALFPETIAVGATGNNDSRASFSSYGPELDLVAPGVSVGPLPHFLSGNQTTAYASASGTSFSSPIVAGIASLIKAKNPNLTPSEVRDILSESSDKVSGMAGFTYLNQYGYGRANAHKATLMVQASTELAAVLGSSSLGSSQQAVGHVWRAYSDNLKSDEVILMGCRVFATDTCSVTAQRNQNSVRFSQSRHSKGKEIQYIFINASDLTSGGWELAVHNNDYASSISSVTK